MYWLSPPKTNYDSIEDIGRFNMIWNASLALVPIFTLLAVMHIILGDKSYATSIAALIVTLSVLMILQRTRNFIVPGIICVIAGMTIIQIVVWLVDDSHVISDTMWCMLVAIFAYFLFDSIVGTFVLLFNLSGLLLYLLLAGDVSVANKGLNYDVVDFKLVVNVIYVGLALAFILHKLVSNSKVVNKRYQAELEENEVLLKEIHHRVKNNLQIVASLLRLQAAEVDSDELKNHFNEAVSRIRSMSLIHEKMYQNEDMANIDVASYLDSLAHEISGLFCSDCHMNVKVHSEVEKIDMNILVSLSLIFNELVTNSIKHGFMDHGSGAIELDIQMGDKIVTMTYSDNGTWRQPSSEGVTFGLDLIKTLTDQMDGSYALTKEEGNTTYQFKIPSSHFA
jgi:two-component sensor histidine kinase